MILLCELCAKKQMSTQLPVLNVCQQYVHFGHIFHKMMDATALRYLLFHR